MDEVMGNKVLNTKKKKDTRSKSKRKVLIKASIITALVQLGIVGGVLAVWQWGVQAGIVSNFLVGSPAGIFERMWQVMLDGSLWMDTKATLLEAIIGFLIGSLVGSVVGLTLWYSPIFARIVEPFIVAINSVPKIAFAPMVILWFGTGMISKIMLAVSLTAIVALIAAYEAAKNADHDLQALLLALGGTKHQIFFKVVVPSTLPAIISTFRINIGFGLVGAVVGEFISSSYGLGHMIFNASSLYDLNSVWVGLFALMFVGFVLYYVVDSIERYLLPWRQVEANQRLRV
jgi:NitT/TauT family transport system permease protein